MSEVLTKAINAKNASVRLSSLSTAVKDSALEAMAEALEDRMELILAENRKDVDAAIAAGRPKALWTG